LRKRSLCHRVAVAEPRGRQGVENAHVEGNLVELIMRPLLTLTLSVAIGAPGGVLAQEIPTSEPPPLAIPAAEPAPPVLAPPPFSVPVEPAPPPEVAPPAPSAEAAPAPDLPPPTTIAPVLVEAQEKQNKLPRQVGGIVGGLAGGAAGAAVAGPVGKIAGGLVGKTVAKKIVGGGKSRKKDIPQVEVAQTAPSAETAATPAAEQAPATEPQPDRPPS